VRPALVRLRNGDAQPALPETKTETAAEPGQRPVENELPLA